MLQSIGSQRVGRDLATENNNGLLSGLQSCQTAWDGVLSQHPK